MKRMMQRLLVSIVILASPSLVSMAPEFGQDREDMRVILSNMCTRSLDTIYGRMVDNPRLFQSWVNELPTVSDPISAYFYPRPHDSKTVANVSVRYCMHADYMILLQYTVSILHSSAPLSSICQPMNTTCCKLKTEKHLAKLAQREYGELFLNVTHESIGKCFTVGRDFYRK